MLEKEQRLIEICQKVTDLYDEYSEELSLFGERLVSTSGQNKLVHWNYYLIKSGDGQKNLMQFTHSDYKWLKDLELIWSNSYTGIHQYIICDFRMNQVRKYLKYHSEDYVEY